MRQEILDWEELQRFEALGADEPDEIKTALGKLTEQGRSRLVKVGGINLNWLGDCRLATHNFTDDNKTQCFVVIDGQGCLYVGLTAKERLTKDSIVTQSLGQFDSLHDEVVSLVVTDKHRHSDDGLDVFITVKRHPIEADADERVKGASKNKKAPAMRVYHGVVRLIEQNVQFKPGYDLFEQPTGGLWQPLSSERLPELYKQFNVSCDQHLDPFRIDNSSHWQGILEHIKTDNQKPLECLSFAHQHLCWASNNTLRIAKSGENFSANKIREQDVSAWIRSVGVVEHSDGCLFIAAGCDDRSISLATLQGDQLLKPIFNQSCEVPVGVSFLSSVPARSAICPDILVAFADGRLSHLRCLETKYFQKLWDCLWQKLDVHNLSDKLQLADEKGERFIRWRKALLVAIAEELTVKAQRPSETDMDTCVNLFRNDPVDGVLLAGINKIIRFFRKHHREDSWAAVSTGHITWLYEFLYKVYNDHAHIAVQDQLDGLFRSIGHNLPCQRDNNLHEFIKRSRVSRADLYRNPGEKIESLNDAIYMSNLCVDRWTNPYWMQESYGWDFLREHPLVDMCSLSNGEKSYFILAVPGGIYPVQVDEHGRLTSTAKLTIISFKKTIRRMIPIPGGEDSRLLIADGEGGLGLYAFDDQATCINEIHRLDKKYGEPRDMSLNLIQALHQARVAVLFAEQNRTHLVIFEVKDNCLIEYSPTRALSLPDVRYVDLAKQRNGSHLFLKGNTLGSVVYSCELDPNGTNIPRRPVHELRHGATALAYDNQLDPETALVADRNGMVWCCPLKQEGLTDHRWSYQFKGVVRAILTITLETEACFLLGTDQGELALLRIADGRRLWKEKLRYPIKQLVPLDATAERIAIAFRGSWITIYQRNHADPDVLTNAKACLLKSKSHPSYEKDGAWGHHDGQMVWAFKGLLIDKKPIESLFNGSSRLTRARLVRFLAEAKTESLNRSNWDKALGELTFRDLSLLLAYLPQAKFEWLPQIHKQIVNRRKHLDAKNKVMAENESPNERELKEDFKDDGYMAEMAAWQALLVYVAGDGKDDLPNLTALDIPKRLFEKRWLCTTVARLLIETVCKPRGDLDVGQLLPHLLAFPPRLIAYCNEALPFGSKSQKELSALKRLIHALEHGEQVQDQKDLETVYTALTNHAQSSWVRFFQKTVALMMQWQRVHEDRWYQQRDRFLRLFRQLQAIVDRLPPDQSWQQPFLPLLRTFFPSNIIPPDGSDDDKLNDWWQAYHRSISAAQVDDPDFSSQGWARFAGALLNSFRSVCEKLEKLEVNFIENAVWPRLTLGKITQSDDGKIAVEFSMDTVGRGHLKDVTLSCDISKGEYGLRKPGILDYQRTWVAYHREITRQRLYFEGFLQPSHSRLQVAIALESKGFKLAFDQTFPIPKRASSSPDGFRFDGWFPHLCDAFLGQVGASQSRLFLMTIYPQWPLARVVESFAPSLVVHHVVFDDIVANYGTGRKLDAQPLSADLLSELLNRQIQKNRVAPGELLLLGPINQIIRRCRDGEAPNALSRWLRQVSESKPIEQGIRIALLVNNRNALYLRHVIQENLPQIAFHLSARQSLMEQKPAQDQLVQKLLPSCKQNRLEALNLCEKAGWDVRYLLQWLEQRKLNSQITQRLDGFLQVGNLQQELAETLRLLKPIEALLLIVAADVKTRLDLSRVKPSMLAAEDIYTTPFKGAPKLIQVQGKAVSEDNLVKIRSDRNPRRYLWVNGFMDVDNVASETFRFHHWLRCLDKKTLVQHFETLTELGFAAYQDGVFLTAEPYRSYIRRITSQVHKGGADYDLYRNLLGEDRFPLEAFSLRQIYRFSEKDLAQWLPRATQDDIEKFRRLARLWAEDPTTEMVQQVLNFLFGEPFAQEVDEQSCSWHRPLQTLGYGVHLRAHEGFEEYWVFVNEGQALNVTSLRKAFKESFDAYQIHQAAKDKEAAQQPCAGLEQKKKDHQKDVTFPRVFVFGPGADGCQTDPKRRLALLDSRRVAHAIWQGDFLRELMHQARHQWDFQLRSPYQVQAALPPGSPCFVGREKEVAFIREHLHKASILIVGSRRAGKTSMLNHIYYRVSNHSEFQAFFVDLQGVASQAAFEEKMALAARVWCRQNGHRYKNLITLVESVQEWGKTPVFLLNEVDAIVKGAPTLLEIMRGLNDQGRARFVMVGYAVLLEVGKLMSPFNHFTKGSDFGGAAILLGTLNPESAGQLLDLMESHLDLSWASDADKQKAYKLSISRSYCIPWVLQRYCQMILENYEAKKAKVLSYDLVQEVVEGRDQVVWQYLEDIDYTKLTPEEAKGAGGAGFKLMLYALARAKYFLGNPPLIEDAKLQEMSHVNPRCQFTVEDAQVAIKQVLHHLFLARQYDKLWGWNDRLNVDEALKLLSLTMIVQPVSQQTGCYGFLGHIFPLELKRQAGEADPQLDGLVIDQAIRLLAYL